MKTHRASLSPLTTAAAPGRGPRTAGGCRARGSASARLDALRGELWALSKMALSFFSDAQPRHDAFDPSVRHPTPLVLVHGLFGTAANFLSLRQFLSTRGLGNF